MAATYNPSLAASAHPHRQNAPNGIASMAAPNVPPGTFLPGTKVQVGSHRVVIEKYLSEGGFAHVYLVRLPSPLDKSDIAVLKRVAVPDKEALANMRTEVETMKKLKGHRHIVKYYDSHASQLKGGGYEVFLLMEYCAGGGLIDFMNTRLQHRLTEPEILKIFADVAEGVACMHYLKPPLLHRDLKVENVLISVSGSSRSYKLCDFGSTAPPRPAATSAAEGRLIEDDVQKHTTLQYRSPEMIDVYRRQPIDEKSDIWALGVLLYKLCYYTTPFEEQGQMAILNASFKFPGYPSFSDRIKLFIASMLRENPQNRPNIFQVVSEVCRMRGTNVPIRDIYAGRSQSEARKAQQLPSPEPKVDTPPVVGAYHSPPVEHSQTIPDIAPMRRGRPTKAPQHHTSASARPSPSPLRAAGGDPFAALDAPGGFGTLPQSDELSSRFPTLDQFSLLHDTGGKFEFSPTSPTNATSASSDLNQRVTEALADEAFAQPRAPAPQASPAASAATTTTTTTTTTTHPTHVQSAPALTDTASLVKQKLPEPRQDKTHPSPSATIYQPTPKRPTMVSTGTMTSATPPPVALTLTVPKTDNRSSSTDSPTQSTQLQKPEFRTIPRPALLESNRSKSQTSTFAIPKPATSSRPSLEGQRPSTADLGDAINRSRSANARPRPSSVYLESNLDYLRDRESSRNRSSGTYRAMTPQPAAMTGSSVDSDKRISSNVEFLRTMEEAEAARKKEKRNSGTSSKGTTSKHVKRSSMPSISLSGTKNILSGKFGDAFRRFENNAASGARTPSPGLIDKGALTPITGSETTGGRSDDDNGLEITEEVPAEVKRELERQRQSMEERRVAQGAAEYRRRLTERGDPGKSEAVGAARAASIQNKVRSLLDENSNEQRVLTHSPVSYGALSSTEAEGLPPRTRTLEPRISNPQRPVPNAQMRVSESLTKGSQLEGQRPRSEITMAKTRQPLQSSSSPSLPSSQPPPVTARNPAGGGIRPPSRGGLRPSAPPKPRSLRSGSQAEPPQPSPTKPIYLQGRPLHPQQQQQFSQRPPSSRSAAEPTSPSAEDWEANFSKRFPSLSGLEMVETEIERDRPLGSIRVKDV
ncbi:hypothetical protein L228DRAFT_230506 [Xylona heveae TC161]|uniref:non-specific serine/threonine protein kinase n=1 Tax=Xylona heveae (strain CBS 132557 / TC161) TaxID=1328760 RepID=A0A165GGG5_XYLHT|nr:hypothetical protein L228DRAFT_230506 [Xylona heveae TC161]KZF22156.1 hypothetical protein L228DRAFT_230506 [Xylona heveae TC161]